MNEAFASGNNLSLESFPAEGDKIRILKNKNIGAASTLDIHTEVPISSKSTKHSTPKLSINIPHLYWTL